MITRCIQVDPDRPSAAALAEAAEVLARGGLVAFVTETVYGLGAVAADPRAVARIFEAKGRPSHNPLIVHVAEIAQARACVRDWPPAAQRLAERFWPGPLTLVLPGSGLIPPITTGGRATVAVRMPLAAVALGLIRRTGQPLAAPSANRSNRISPTRAEHVLADLDGRIDLVLDSGPTEHGLESTVIDLTSHPARILRPGPISLAELDAVLEGLERVAIEPPGSIHPADTPSPGMQPTHYAPQTPAYRLEASEDLAALNISASDGLLVLGPTNLEAHSAAAHRVILAEPLVAGRELYAALHELDALGLDRLVILMPPDEPEWYAVRDRLKRAAQSVPPRTER